MKLKSLLWLLITCEALILLPIFPGLAEEDPAVTAGIEWLRGAAGPNGGFGAVVDARRSGLAAAALGAHGHDVTDAVSSLASISPANAEEASFRLLAAPEPTNAAHLLSFQLPDGSYGSIRVTALSLLALSRSGRPAPGARDYLFTLQNDDGSFGPGHNLLDTAH